MKRFLMIAVATALLCGIACAQDQAIVMAPSTAVSKTVVRGPFGFVRARAKSICTNCAPAIEACAPATVAPVQACAPAVEACAPVTEACAPVVEACAPVCVQAPVCTNCFTKLRATRTVIKERPRILPKQVIRTKTVVR